MLKKSFEQMLMASNHDAYAWVTGIVKLASGISLGGGAFLEDACKFSEIGFWVAMVVDPRCI